MQSEIIIRDYNNIAHNFDNNQFKLTGRYKISDNNIMYIEIEETREYSGFFRKKKGTMKHWVPEEKFEFNTIYQCKGE